MNVAARELKNRLGKYFRRVKSGHAIIVTDRGVPVAELRPIEVARLSVEERLERMAVSGDLTLPSGRRSGPFQPVAVRGKSVSATLLEDRD